MKQLIITLVTLITFGCSVPYRVVETYTTDSTGKSVKVIQKYYDNSTYVETPPRPSQFFYGDPFWFYGPRFYYSRPIIVNPRPQYQPRPLPQPRPGFGRPMPAPRGRH